LLFRLAGTAITFQRALNPIVATVDRRIPANHPLSGQKSVVAMEQKAVVAVPSQLGTITAPALPRSNQNEATLFD
jgi:hypothetical protein